MRLIDLIEGKNKELKKVIKRHARRLADNIAGTYHPTTVKFWAKHLSQQTAHNLSHSYKKPYGEVHKALAKKTIEYLGENMELRDILEQEERYKLYVDLDGVLVDFVKLAKEWVPGWEEENVPGRSKKLDGKLWAKIGGLTKQGVPFWGQMDPMPDAMELWGYIKKYNPEILSATGTVGNPVPEKKSWVQRHLGPNVKVNLVQKAVDKAQFAAPGRILIDDKLKAINPWIAAGGIGVHHTSAANTIAQLKELGL